MQERDGITNVRKDERHLVKQESSLGCRCEEKWETPSGIKKFMV